MSMYFLDVSEPLSKVIIITFCVPSSKVTTILMLLFFKSIDSKLDDLGILINSGNLNLSFLFLGSKKNSLIIINTIIIIPKVITTVNILTRVFRKFKFN